MGQRRNHYKLENTLKLMKMKHNIQNSEKEGVPNSMLILKIKPCCLKYGHRPIASVSPRTWLELLNFGPLTRSAISESAL